MVMAEKEGVPKRVTLASIVYELVLGFGTAVMVGAYFVIQLPKLEHQPARYAVLLRDPDRARVPPPARLQAAHRLRPPQARAGAAHRRCCPSAQVLKFSLMYIGCWAVIGVGVYAFAKALQPLPASDFPYVAAAYPVAFCVAVLTFIVPSGLGTRDAALAVAIAAVLDETVATAIAVGFRIFQTLDRAGLRGARRAAGPPRPRQRALERPGPAPRAERV